MADVNELLAKRADLMRQVEAVNAALRVVMADISAAIGVDPATKAAKRGYWADAARKCRAKKLAAGLCAKCGENPPGAGRDGRRLTICDTCRARMAEKYRAKRTA